MMKNLLFALIFLPLLLTAQNLLPWKNSTLWSEDSSPLPLDGKVRRLEKCGDECCLTLKIPPSGTIPVLLKKAPVSAGENQTAGVHCLR